MKAYQKRVNLYNNTSLPQVGFGTWQVKPGEEAYQAVKKALKHGYRHIDTALAYGNEASVGKAIRDSGIPRNEIFVTTKLPAEKKTAEEAENAINESLKNLDLDYIDLYLIHAPWPWSNMGQDCNEGNVEIYKVMETHYKAGHLKAIGVSNFSPDDIENIITHCDIVPMVNQIGYFIGLDQSKTINYCKEKNILIEAYSPLGIGYLLTNPTIKEIAHKNNVSPAQICIRYLLQKEVVPLPKSVHEERIIQNTQLDFIIPKEDMDILDTIKGDPRRWE